MPFKKSADLGLTYEQAAHGVQTGIGLRLARDYPSMPPEAQKAIKHLRVGIDMSKSDMMGFATLLMDKGLFTPEEYAEYMRLAANAEVALHEKTLKKKYGIDITLR